MHVTGLRVEKEEDLPEVMEQFLKCEGPVILDAVVRFPCFPFIGTSLY